MGVARRARMGGSLSRGAAAPTLVVRAADRLRQARHRHVRSCRRCAAPGNAHGRRPGGGPGMVKALSRMNAEIDVRPVLPSIRVPTLLLHGDRDYIPVEGARYMAERIPDARLVELPGMKHLPVGEEFDRFAGELARF